MQNEFPNSEILTITHLGGQGDGVAEYRGKQVSIPFAAAGEKVRAQLLGTHGKLLEVVQEAPTQRQVPPCAYFTVCGGCNTQHLAKSAYLAFKQQRLKDALARAGYRDANVMPVAEISPASRRRVEFKVKAEKGEVSLGFYRPETHDVIAIDHCAVALPEIIQLLPALKALVTSLKKSGNIVAIQVSAFDEGIELLFKARAEVLPRDKQLLAAALKIKGVLRVALWVKESNHAAEKLAESAPSRMRFGNSMIEMPVGAFMQATAQGQALLSEAAASVVVPKMRVADLYAGCGTYSFPMAEKGAYVFAYEGALDMVMAASSAAKANKLQDNLLFEARDLVKRPLKAEELSGIDVVVINPPRAGASRQSAEVAKAKVKHVVLISCNPATLAQDVKHFAKAGYKLISATPVDQFLWTGHLESIIVLAR